MKTIKYILSVLAILSLSLFCFSCMDEEISKNDENWSDGKTLRLTLSAPENRVVSPMTKSAQADTMLTDLNILIYDNTGQLINGVYYDGTNEVVTTLQAGTKKQLNIELDPNAEGNIYAVANYGYNIYTSGSDFRAETALKSAQFNINGTQPKKYMYADGGRFKVGDPTLNKKSLELTRIYALVTVKVVKNLAQPTGGTFDVIPTSLQIKNIPTKGQFAPGNLITKGSESADGEMLSLPEGDPETNFLSREHSEAQALYLFENRQPDGSSLNNNTDQTTKTPNGMPADEIVSIIKTNRTCSYIEMHAKYIRNGQEEGVGSGSIIHRFFLGKDVFKNFDVERNVHYQVTLTLNGKGGADEATWRVETSLIGDIQAPDVYVGYRAGSKTRMYITGTGVPFIQNISSTVIHIPVGGSDKGFIVSAVQEETMPDGTKRSYVDIQADVTNTHDYDKKIGQVTFSINGNGIKKDFTAKVYQVPRLVDPIAFYKKAENMKPVHIRVKEFYQDAAPPRGAYINLVSKGPWTATIKQSSASGANWYRIYNTDENGVEIQNTTGSGLDYKISGEGPVQFGYQPLSQNTASDGDGGEIDKARYGMIQVKYHNDWCEHEIFLRQGYQPTTLGHDDYSWSLFNVGKNGNTTSPTQTGWLFNGGANIGMHPFIPGHGTTEADKNAPVEYADGSVGKVGKNGADKYPWDNDKQGPCPAGYIVPKAQIYRNMVENTTIYTGYVHDDDAEAGWKWGANGDAEIDASMHCNPAKGSLFVEKTGDLCKNLFFNYGKGVLTGVREGRGDQKLIEEIGIGRRYNPDMKYQGGLLSHSDYTELPRTFGYGGFYWNGSGFNSGSYHMGKVDFGYNIFSRYPSLIDVPGLPVAPGSPVMSAGIDARFNASFVRCVKKIDRTYMINTKLKAGTLFTATIYTDGSMAWRDFDVIANGKTTPVRLDGKGKVNSDVLIECKSDASVIFRLGGYSITILGSKIAEIENTTSYQFGPGTGVVIQ